jgi:predicted restriction endonuclease
MNLYCQLPFGQFDKRTKIIIEVAEYLGRTPSSLSMKLCNLASLDPFHQKRGIKGLSKASLTDKAIWEEFNSNLSELAPESERLLENLFKSDHLRHHANEKSYEIPSYQTEHESLIKQRRGQSFFRKTVFASFNNRCCITDNPVPELLRASHILPWAEYAEHRLNPRNGLCLAATHDVAFDRGLITFDEKHRLILSRYLKEFLTRQSVSALFSLYEGKSFTLPERFLPDPCFLEKHRNSVFIG